MVKGCLGTSRGDLLREFLQWNLEGEDWASGKDMGTVTYCALGGHAETSAGCASLEESNRLQLYPY